MSHNNHPSTKSARTYHQRTDEGMSHISRPNENSVLSKIEEHAHNMKIIKSYKAHFESVPCTIHEKLIERGMSRGERICLGCFKIMLDEGKSKCYDCREAKYLANKDRYIMNRKLKQVRQCITLAIQE